MSIPQVGQGSVAVVPTFRGFRKSTDAQFGLAAKSGKSIFDTGFKAAGASSGKGFASSFTSSTKGLTSNALRGVQAEVAKASREVAALRIREADATGKVRLAEAQLVEARRKYADGSSQAIRAEERLASAQRQTIATKTNLLGATERLTAAQRNLAAATTSAADAGGRSGGVFSRLTTTFGDAGRNGANRFSQGFKDVLGGVLGANIITGIGYTIGRGIGDAARAGMGYAFEAVGLASDFEQSSGAVTAQFKDQAAAIFDAARVGARTVGLSKATYQQYSAIVGAQLKNLGIRQEDVAGNTTSLIGLGADLAAQFGGPTSQAVEALGSLLRGERDPIERYGVSIKQADINARLAAMGMEDLTGEAEKQATVQATLALLWEQTADAQGTYIRERDTTYAGRLATLNAELANAQQDFGDSLLPSAVAALEFVNDELLPVLQDALGSAGPQISSSLKAAMPEIESTLKELGENLPELINLGGTIASAVSDSVGGDFGEGGIIGGIPRVKSELEGFGQWLTRDFSEYADWEDYWTTFGDGFEHWWDVAWDGVDDGAAQRAKDTTERTVSGFRDFLAQERGTEIGTALGTQIGGAVSAALEAEAAKTKAWGEIAAEGFAMGLDSKLARIEAAGTALGQASIKGLQKGTDSHSPSRFAMAVGDDTGEGFGLGVRGRLSYVEKSASTVASAAIASLASAKSLVTTGSATAAAVNDGPTIDARQYVTVDAERDPRITGRQYGREFLREIAGDAP